MINNFESQYTYGDVSRNANVTAYRQKIAVLGNETNVSLPLITSQQIANAKPITVYDSNAFNSVNLGGLSLTNHLQQAMHAGCLNGNRTGDEIWRATSKAVITAARTAYADPKFLIQNQLSVKVFDSLICRLPNFMGSGHVDESIFINQAGLDRDKYASTVKGILNMILSLAQSRGNKYIVIPPIGLGVYVRQLNPINQKIARYTFAECQTKIEMSPSLPK